MELFPGLQRATALRSSGRIDHSEQEGGEKLYAAIERLRANRKLACSASDELNKPIAEITIGDLCCLRRLTVNSWPWDPSDSDDFDTLDGIRAFVGLQKLILGGECLGDIGELSGLQRAQTRLGLPGIRELTLCLMCDIDLAPLADLISLQGLRLRAVTSCSLEPLARLSARQAEEGGPQLTYLEWDFLDPGQLNLFAALRHLRDLSVSWEHEAEQLEVLQHLDDCAAVQRLQLNAWHPSLREPVSRMPALRFLRIDQCLTPWDAVMLRNSLRGRGVMVSHP